MVSKPTAVTATALVASSALVALLCALHLAHKPALSATEALELVQRADVLAAGRDFHAAAALYEEALQHRSLPHREVANYNLAIALRDGGELERALQAMNATLMQLDRSDSRRAHRVLIQIAEIAATLGAWELASMHWRAAAALETSDHASLSNAASALLNQRSAPALRRAIPLLRALVASLLEEAAGDGDGAAERGDRVADEQLAGAADRGRVQGGLTYARARLAVALALLPKAEAEAADDERQGLLKLLLERLAHQPSAESRRAAIFAAFSLEETNPTHARQLLEECARGEDAAAALGLQASSVFYRLGRLLRLSGRATEELALYERAVAQGVWTDAAQRPGYIFRGRPLLAKPWHALAELPPSLAAAVLSLHARYDAIRREVLGALELGGHLPRSDDRRSQADAGRAGSTLRLHDDQEQIADAGRWRQIVFARNGRTLPEAWEGRLPVTEQMLAELAAEGGLSHRLPKGSMEVSILGGRSHLKPHCGPSNHRLRLHLPLLVPEGARMRVGDETRPWREGVVAVFDDSFDHEVWNDGPHSRVVLLIDVWHPDLHEMERERVRADFRFEESSWWTLGSPWGRGVVSLSGRDRESGAQWGARGALAEGGCE